MKRGRSSTWHREKPSRTSWCEPDVLCRQACTLLRNPLGTLSLIHISIVVIGIYLGFKREFSKLIGFLVIALIAVGLVFNAGGVKDVLLELFNRIIGA